MGDQLTGLVRNIHVELTAGSGGVVVHSSTVVLGERSAAYVQNAIREWPFGETPRPYYCRDQVRRKEQGCALSSGGRSTEHHGRREAKPTAQTTPAQPWSLARSACSASSRRDWARLARPSTVPFALPNTGRCSHKLTTPGTGGPSPTTPGIPPTICSSCATT